MKPLLLHGRGGLGDAVFMRPFVREASRTGTVYVDTSWPELYADLNAHVVRRIGGLALQRHHGDRHPDETWEPLPSRAKPVNLRYRWSKLLTRSMMAEMELLSGIHPDPFALDLPPLPDPVLTGRYAVIRPPAARLDYPGPAREPDPAYVRLAAEFLRAEGWTVVTLGAFVPGLEEPASDPIPADVRYEHGEQPLLQALSLVANADLIVTSPGWMLPVGMAAKTPVVVLAGGCGGRNFPDALADPRLGSKVTWLLPDDYCHCRSRTHACPKVIPGFPDRFAASVAELAVAA